MPSVALGVGEAASMQATFGRSSVDALDEIKHFKLLGTTGTGKSTAIREMLAGAIGRGDRAVIADPDGGYLSRFHARDRGDVILNPFDADSVSWDWRAEIRNHYDVEQLASGLIPSSNDAAGQEWRGYARTFLTAVARRCCEAGRRDPSELWRLLTVASSEELRPVVAGTPAQPFLDPDNARMFGSIRSVTSSAVAALEHVQAQRAPPFSVRRWVRDRTPGVLFIPYNAGQIAALRSMIAAWLRLAIFETMSQPEDRDQRLWFVVDELDALGAIDGLKDALARLRKFGGRCVLGFQSIAQVSSTYGNGDAQTNVLRLVSGRDFWHRDQRFVHRDCYFGARHVQCLRAVASNEPNAGLDAGCRCSSASRGRRCATASLLAMLVNLVCTFEVFLLTQNLLTLLDRRHQIHGLCLLLCCRDPRLLRSTLLSARTRLPTTFSNLRISKASSYSR